MPYKRIAAALGISPSSALYWTRDIKLTAKQHTANLGTGGSADAAAVSRRARAWSETCRARRRAAQAEGRRRAGGGGESLHRAGCMLYWAEGRKNKNQVRFCNSDSNMVRFFLSFVRECFAVRDERIALQLNVYLGNGLELVDVEDHWLGLLDLPRSCLRKPQINHFPTSSSGRKKNKLPYGVCTVTVLRSTPLVQHIFGAIQEYAGFDEPAWLD